MKYNLVFSAMILAAWFFLPGCISNRAFNPSTTRPVTQIDPIYASADYWWSQPASVSIPGSDVDKLWDCCERTARAWLFSIEVQNHRAGILATEPMITKQFWEWWRKDAGTFKDTQEATLTTTRRTIRFEFAREPGGGCVVTPKVLVERKSTVDSKYALDTDMPGIYWYAIRRDTPMELKLAESIRQRLAANP